MRRRRRRVWWEITVDLSDFAEFFCLAELWLAFLAHHVVTRYNAATMSSLARTIHVQVPGSEYDVTVEPGLLNEAGSRLRQLGGGKRAAIVTDSIVGPLYAATLAESLIVAGFEVTTVTIPTGESNKSLSVLATIYDQLLAWGMERSTPLLALGGGVIGDMTGFAAATILRGVPFVQVPTTLLAMVDASVGGKTGIDHSAGKNLIGAFHQPLAVLIDPAVLASLLPVQLQSGLAECIKHDIIRDVVGFQVLESNIQRALEMDMEYLTGLIAHNVAIKARVVANDPYEKGARAHLNLGHTFGHAIETVSQYKYTHGQGVALGMVAAARCAVELGMLDGISAQRISDVISKAGLPIGGLELDVDAVVKVMSVDKKVKGGRIRFILPDRLGHVVIRDDVPNELVRRTVETLRG